MPIPTLAPVLSPPLLWLEVELPAPWAAAVEEVVAAADADPEELVELELVEVDVVELVEVRLVVVLVLLEELEPSVILNVSLTADALVSPS